jgi:hypothetical protein
MSNKCIQILTLASAVAIGLGKYPAFAELKGFN